MISSHDSFTYQRPKNILLSLVPFFWRCQKKTIKEQYDLGVRVFDIRIYRNKENKWGTAHGIAYFNESFDSLSSICIYFKKNYPDSFIRIFLEDNVKNDNKLKDLFLAEADEAYGRYGEIIWEIGTHHPWISYYRNQDFHPHIKEYYCHLFNWNTDRDIKYNLKNFDWSSWCLPLYSKKHNPVITQEMIEDKETMYIMDYIGIYPKNKEN